MRRPGGPATIAFLVLLFGTTYVVRARAGTPEPVVDPTKPCFLKGCYVLPPRGEGWMIVRDIGSLTFVRQAGSKTHTCVASVSARFVPHPATDPDSFRVGVAASLGVSDEERRFRPIAFEVLPDTARSPLGAQYRFALEDHEVPHYKGKTFVLTCRGLRFMHPQAPTLLIAVDYTERTGPGDPPADSADAIAFLAGFKTVVRDTAVGRRLQVGFDTDAVAEGDGSVWVGRYRYASLEGEGAAGHDEVIRLDPATHTVLVRVPVADDAVGLAATENAMWVTNAGRDHPGIQRIDVATNQVTTTVKFGKEPRFVVYGAGRLWVTDPAAGTVWRIDPLSGTPEARSTRGLKAPACIAFAEGQVWVADAKLKQLVSIDPATGQVAGSPIGIGAWPSAIVWGAGSLWVLSDGMDAVQRIDPARRAIVGTIPLSSPASAALAFVDGNLWAASVDGSLVRIDPQANRVDGTRAAMVAPGRMTSVGSSLWISDRVLGSVVVIP